MRKFNITGQIWGAHQDDLQAVQGETLTDALFNYYDLMERRWIEENAPTTSPECIHIETGTGNHTRECVEPCYGVYISRIEEIIPLYEDGIIYNSSDVATIQERLKPDGVIDGLIELIDTRAD